MTTTSISSIKRCSKCGFECPYEQASQFFAKDRCSKDKFQHNCKTCKAIYRANNKLRIQIVNKAYRANNREKIKAYRAGYILKNRVKLQAQQSLYYRDHRERQLQGHREYRKANPERHRIDERNRQARKRGLPDDFTVQDWEFCLNYWHGRCAYCGKQAEGLWQTVNREHFVPLSDVAHCPGTVRWNMLPACEHCNRNKHNKEPRSWVVNTFGKHKGAQILKRIDTYFEQMKGE